MLNPAQIDANLHEYVFGSSGTGGIGPCERYASFDYCFNYFQSFRESGEVEALANAGNLQTSCLQLGFYLASWGMLRGSSFLLDKSVRLFASLIAEISKACPALWELDVNSYDAANIEMILDFKKVIINALGKENNPSDILVTKIMLGVFGNVPAFDSYFKEGFGVSTFGRSALQRVGDFYHANAELIEKNRIPTLDFDTGKPTGRLYTRAKVVDMIFFIEGSKRNRLAKPR